jgi:hypothetical protein
MKAKDSFYTKLTHKDYQPQEVEAKGDGFGDSYLPKVPNTDKHSKTNLK